MFLSTNSSLAWLYHCPLMRSPPQVMNQYYDKIHVFYKISIFFVHPTARQTYPDANFQKCSYRIKNLFQFDMEYENSWFTISPNLEHRKRPAVFGPKNVTSVSRRNFGGARRCRILHASTTVTILGQSSYQRCFKESFAKILSRSHRPQHSNSWTRTLFLINSAYRLLFGQYDFPLLLQKSLYRHFWINRLRSGNPWNLFLLLFVHRADCGPHSSGLKTF